MFASLRSVALSRPNAIRNFSSTSRRTADVAKLILVGRLTKDPETRLTRNEKEFVAYTVATRNYPSPPPDANGERRPSTSTFHRILSFQDGSNRYLQTLKKGTQVYVEAGYELREPDASADPSTPQGQRQIFLKHESIRVLSIPKSENTQSEEESE